MKAIFGILMVLPLLLACEAATECKRMGNEDLKTKLNPLQYHVTQECGTEPPFRNEFWDNKTPGIYVDVVSGEPLFSSTDKFDSGTGWPSFIRPLTAENVIEHKDVTHGMTRVEVRSKMGDSHLGHVFEDGPNPTGLRYCINSASLRFIPVERLEAEGFGKYLSLFGKESVGATASGAKAIAHSTQIAVLAGGCFWGVEELLRKVPGVIETQVGYTGGAASNPTYEMMTTGTTGHAESVRITFDPARLSYEDLLRYFFRLHDPTTKNRQGNDVGTQYRSAIFVASDEQREVAERVKREIDASGKWKAPVTTEIVTAATWYPAEDYHQDYLQKHPNGYTCHYLRD